MLLGAITRLTETDFLGISKNIFLPPPHLPGRLLLARQPQRDIARELSGISSSPCTCAMLVLMLVLSLGEKKPTPTSHLSHCLSLSLARSLDNYSDPSVLTSSSSRSSGTRSTYKGWVEIRSPHFKRGVGDTAGAGPVARGREEVHLT